MKTAKALAREVLDALPDDATLEEIHYQLYVRDKVEQGLRDMEQGNVFSHEEVVRESAEWLDE